MPLKFRQSVELRCRRLPPVNAGLWFCCTRRPTKNVRSRCVSYVHIRTIQNNFLKSIKPKITLIKCYTINRISKSRLFERVNMWNRVLYLKGRVIEITKRAKSCKILGLVILFLLVFILLYIYIYYSYYLHFIFCINRIVCQI